jgi:DNA-binding transcriptional regulator YhcF (GntR family)
MNEEKHNYIYNQIRDVKVLNGLELDAFHKSILFCLESYGKKIFPSFNCLSMNAGCSISTAQRKIKDLENHGIIKHKRRTDLSNSYTIIRSEIKKNYFDEKSQKDAKSEWIE